MALRSKLTIVIAAVVAVSAGFWLSSIWQSNNDKAAESAQEKAHEIALAKARKNFSPIQGIILSPARKIAVPALIKDDGKIFTLDDLTGHWSLLFFGYTHCPDICPVTMGVVAQAKKTAAADGKTFPDVFFVSVDPERDKVNMLGEYVQYFDKDFIGVTGDKDLINALALQMSVVNMKMPVANTNDSGYLVDHSAALLLLNPEGKLVAFLNPPHDPKAILEDIEKVISLQD
jgi:protein SCO1